MEDMEAKLSAILGDPDIMGKISAFAQTLNQGDPGKENDMSSEGPPGSFPEFDPKLLQKLSGMANNSRIDNDQQLLLKALRPYLSGHRLNKLERAMRAAKMASMASVFLSASSASR